jgi:RimJ/RimL family protein N-acetyltransferase
VQIACGRFCVRTLTADDATDRWAAWMSDPKNLRLLNAAPKTMTRADVAAYIGQFDQRTHLLLGIFENRSGLLIGFFRVDIDPALNRCLGFMMIGEQKFRHWRVTEELRVPFQDLIFETFGLDKMLGTALASNRPMIRYLLKSGWTLDKAAARHVKSNVDGTMLDLCFLSITREAWRAWKKRRGIPL